MRTALLSMALVSFGLRAQIGRACRRGDRGGGCRGRARRSRCTSGSAASRRSPRSSTSSSADVAADKRIKHALLQHRHPRTSRSCSSSSSAWRPAARASTTGRDMDDLARAAWSSSTRSSTRSSRISSARSTSSRCPAKEKGELLGALGPLKPQIVDPPSAPRREARRQARRQGSPDARPAQDGKDKARRPPRRWRSSPRKRGQRNYAEQLFSRAPRCRSAPKDARVLDRGAVPRRRADAHHDHAQEDAEGHGRRSRRARRRLRGGRAGQEAGARLAHRRR